MLTSAKTCGWCTTLTKVSETARNSGDALTSFATLLSLTAAAEQGKRVGGGGADQRLGQGRRCGGGARIARCGPPARRCMGRPGKPSKGRRSKLPAARGAATRPKRTVESCEDVLAGRPLGLLAQLPEELLGFRRRLGHELPRSESGCHLTAVSRPMSACTTRATSARVMQACKGLVTLKTLTSLKSFLISS